MSVSVLEMIGVATVLLRNPPVYLISLYVCVSF